FFFFYIGISIRMSSPSMILAGTTLTILIFGARILTAKLAINSELSATDKAAIAIMGPKGLVSAVLLSLAVSAGFHRTSQVQELVYSAILSSIILSALLSFAIEKKLLDDYSSKIFKQDNTPAGQQGPAL
ncbi:MAG TPA: hypothetical protein PLL10_03120, partial [Elusimicrobiales bacterium]|nr:hypothetical protein [Elusimicrobiales bacterium]